MFSLISNLICRVRFGYYIYIYISLLLEISMIYLMVVRTGTYVTGVHTHMTNTRITDPEILERRFPVLLRRFILREGSGGRGHHHGGDGVIRELEFRRPLIVSILSERRASQPYGLQGGNPGSRGMNLLSFAGDERRVVNLGGKNTVQVSRVLLISKQMK